MRLLTALILLFAMAGASPAHAQDEDLSRYYPLSLGDTWIYGNYYWDCFEKECDLDAVFVRRTVVDEVEIEGETYAAVEVDVLERFAGTVLCTSTYGARVDVDVSEGDTTAFVDIVDLGPPCPDAFLPGDSEGYLEEMRSLANSTPQLQTRNIGGVNYQLTVRSESFDPDLREVDIAFGRDVGLVDLDWYRDIGPGFSEYGAFALQYAVVGGVTYGVPPVANEPGTPTSDRLTIGLHPNPTRGPMTLQLTGAAAEPTTVEVFDVLGRRMLRGDLGVQPTDSSVHRLDLADAPAGLYIVRVSSGSESVTKRLVKVD